MKIQKLKVLVFTLVACLAFSNFTFCQVEEQRGKRGGKNLSAMKQELNLTAEQERELEAINKTYKAKFQELRQSESEDKWAELKALKAEHHAATTAILTPEQAEKLEKRKIIRAEKRDEYRQASKERRKEAKKDFKDKTMPLLKAQRKKLDADITVRDKKEIDRLRKVAKDIKATCKAEKEAFKKERKENGEDHKRFVDGKRPFKGKDKVFYKMKTENPDEFKSLSSLTKKYESKIRALHEEIEPQLEQWKAEKKEAWQKHLEEKDISAEKKAKIREKMAQKKEAREKKYADKKGAFKAMSFLLLNPNEVSPQGRELKNN